MRRFWSIRLTLGTKLGAVIVLCVALTMAVAATLFMHQAQVAADARAQKLAAEAADSLADRIRQELQGSFHAVAATGDSLVALNTHGIRDRRVADVLLEHIVENGKGRFGSWAVWLPNTFDGRDKEFSGKANTDATGRYLTSWRRTGSDIASDAVSGYGSDLPLFRAPLDSGKAFLSEPYYIVGPNGEHASVVSYSEPIRIDGKVVGALGVDVGLDALHDALASIAKQGHSKLTLVSNGGTVVVTTRPELKETSLQESRSGLATEFARARTLDGMDRRLEGSNGPTLRSWRPISFASINAPWYLMSESAIRPYASDAERERIPTITVALAVLFVMLGLILAAMRGMVTKPLARVEQFIKNLRDGNEAAHWRDAQRTDEIGSIAKTLAAFKATESEVASLKSSETKREAQFAAARQSELHEVADHLARSVQAAAKVVDTTS